MRPIILAAAGLVLLSACVEEPPVNGAAIFQENCASCHGSDGRGLGPAAEGLGVAPPDLTRISVRNGGVFPRDRVMSTIDGYARGTHADRIMPEFGAGDMGDTIIVEDAEGRGIPVPERLLALTEYLVSIQRD